MAFRLFRIVRAVDRSFALSVFFLYVGLFVLALPMIFLFPPAPLILLFLGLAGLLIAAPAAAVLRAASRIMARHLMRSGICPGCSRQPAALHVGPALAGGGDGPNLWHCLECGSTFHASGTEEENGRVS